MFGTVIIRNNNILNVYELLGNNSEKIYFTPNMSNTPQIVHKCAQLNYCSFITIFIWNGFIPQLACFPTRQTKKIPYKCMRENLYCHISVWFSLINKYYYYICVNFGACVSKFFFHAFPDNRWPRDAHTRDNFRFHDGTRQTLPVKRKNNNESW